MSETDRRTGSPSYQSRVEAVRERVDIVDVIGRVVKLRGRGKPRGQCPFHGSKSDSFAVDPDRGRARCWGCQWSGDAIGFVMDYHGLSFRDALERLESEHGLDGLAPAPVRRAKVARAAPERVLVSSAAMGRWLWDHARPAPDQLRVYLTARGIPAAVLTDERLRDVRFLGLAPIVPWPESGGPGDVPQAPAMVALVRRAPGGNGGEGRDWAPIGVHVTYLAPALDAKMARKRSDGSNYPARKMLGGVAGGGVMLGAYRPDLPLFVGEGLETVLSGIGLAGAGPEACGLAVLSLDSLQGHPRLIRGALPLYDPQPDPARPAVAFAHGGPVTGLIDADMKPLRGPRDRETGAWRGEAVIERKGAEPVRRTITTAERAELCAALMVPAWRAKGCAVTAIRPRMGWDFNDAIREGV